MSLFEKAFETFLLQQKSEARDMRSEMLSRDLTGTKKLCEVLWQVFGSFDDLVLEQESVGTTGVKIYADVFHPALRMVFDANGFVAHAEKITRDRFNFEQSRIRSFMMLGYKYIPFSWDELDKKPDMCKRAVFEILGRFGNGGNRSRWMELPVYEREILRCAAVHPGSFGFSEVCFWLQLGAQPARNVVRNLIDKNLVSLVGGSSRRLFRFRLTEGAVRLL